MWANFTLKCEIPFVEKFYRYFTNIQQYNKAKAQYFLHISLDLLKRPKTKLKQITEFLLKGQAVNTEFRENQSCKHLKGKVTLPKFLLNEGQRKIIAHL